MSGSMDANTFDPDQPLPLSGEAGVDSAKQSPAGAARAGKTALCPYCGHLSVNLVSCVRCRGLFEPLSRQASQNTMGPWFIRDEANPFRPGCSYQTLRTLVERGRVNGTSILRGPSTRQFWTLASRTPGISHLLGVCYACQTSAKLEDTSCGKCQASFVVPRDRQVLGLADVRLIPGQSSASQIAASMKKRGVGGSGGEAGRAEPRVIELDSTEQTDAPRPLIFDVAPAPSTDTAIVLPIEQEPSSRTEEKENAADDAWERAIRRTSAANMDDGSPGGLHRAMVIALLGIAGAGVLLVLVIFAVSIVGVLNARRVVPAGGTSPALPAGTAAPSPAAAPTGTSSSTP